MVIDKLDSNVGVNLFYNVVFCFVWKLEVVVIKLDDDNDVNKLFKFCLCFVFKLDLVES